MNVHMGTAILCASLPTYRPLFTKMIDLTTSFRERYGSRFTAKSSSGSGKSNGHADSSANYTASAKHNNEYAKLVGSASAHTGRSFDSVTVPREIV